MWLIKVARVVNLKLAFTYRFFYNLIILIMFCKTPYLHLDNALLFPRNQFVWKLKTLTNSNYHKSLIFFGESFLLNNFYKRVFGSFIILFRSWVINKSVKREFVETRSFWFLQITQDLNKIKKSRTSYCRHC